MSSQHIVILQVEAATSNNEATRFHRQNNLQEAIQHYRIALHKLTTAAAATGESTQPSISPLNHCDFMSSQLMSVTGNLSQPLHINPSDVLDGKYTLSIESLIILYNLGLVSLRMGDMRKAVGFFESALCILDGDAADIVPLATINATFVVSLYCNLGMALYEIHENESEEEEALFMFTEALRIGREYLGNHVILVAVLKVLGRVLLSRGNIGDAMMVFDDASLIYNRVCISQMMNSPDILNSGGAPAA